MRRILTGCLLACAAVICASPAVAEGNANVVLGSRSLDEDFWTPTDSQDVF